LLRAYCRLSEGVPAKQNKLEKQAGNQAARIWLRNRPTESLSSADWRVIFSAVDTTI